jgi:riboflavin synthase
MQRTVYDATVVGVDESKVLARRVKRAHPDAQVVRVLVPGSEPHAWRVIAQLPKVASDAP